VIVRCPSVRSTSICPSVCPVGRHLRLAAAYDTIRDAILTCARKPTRVSLIYRTETTTKSCKTQKLKSKSRYVRNNSKSLGNHVVSSEEEKERLRCMEKICTKRRFQVCVMDMSSYRPMGACIAYLVTSVGGVCGQCWS